MFCHISYDKCEGICLTTQVSPGRGVVGPPRMNLWGSPTVGRDPSKHITGGCVGSFNDPDHNCITVICQENRKTSLARNHNFCCAIFSKSPQLFRIEFNYCQPFTSQK
jgi:hypothetical protein